MPYALKTVAKDGGIALPCEITDHLSGATETDLKALIYMYADGNDGGFEEEKLFEVLESDGISRDEISGAISFWRGAGFLKKVRVLKKKEEEKTKKILFDDEKKPSYPSEEIARAIEETPDIKLLVDYCQKRFGKMFNPSQLATLYSFYDNMKFSIDVIMLVAEHCGVIEKMSLNYMEKILITLSNNNIFEYENAEKYLANQIKYRGFEGKLRKMCGFTDRELTPSEKKILNTWFNERNTNFALIEKAYEITVDKIGKPSLKYMEAILSAWNIDGIKSIEDIDSKKSVNTAEKSHDVNDFFKAAISKSASKT